MAEPGQRARLLKDLGQYATLGMEMSFSVVIGAGIGWWIDEKIGTKPWMLVIWLCFGFAAGIRSLMRAARRITRRNDGGKTGD